jgi:hypothetical protein
MRRERGCCESGLELAAVVTASAEWNLQIVVVAVDLRGRELTFVNDVLVA